MNRRVDSDSGRFRLESGIWRLVSRDAFTKPGASNGIVQALAEWLESQDRHLEDFLKGVAEPLQEICYPQGEISWESLVRIYKNLGDAFSEDELREGGRFILRSSINAHFTMVLRQLRSVREMYYEMRSTDASWVRAAYPGVHMELTDLGPGMLLYQVKARPGYTFPKELAFFEKGTLEVMPTVWGLPMADVHMRWIPDGAQYAIQFPRDRAPLIRLRRFFYRLLYRPRLIVEYRDTIVRLQQNYRKLSAALEQREKLCAERDQLVAAIGAAEESVIITDRYGVIEYVNNHFTRQTGYESREARGKRPSILRSALHGNEFFEEMWSALTKGEPWRGALVNRRKDGSFYEAELSISPVRDHTGAVTHYVSVERDVTERNRLNALLQGSFPEPVLAELRKTNEVKPRRHESVAVLFADIVGFTGYSADFSPSHVLRELQGLVEALDPLIEAHGLMKVKTIGDAYLATAGLFGEELENPVERCVEAGRAMINAVNDLGNGWKMRVGIDFGPLISGVIGRRQRFFDIWGDTVNTAARVQAVGRPHTISLSERAWDSMTVQLAEVEPRIVTIKGKGALTLYELAAHTDPEPEHVG